MRFSIRDLLLVTALVALAVAWWVDHRRQAVAIEQLKEELQARHFFLTFSDQLNLPAPSVPAQNPPKK